MTEETLEQQIIKIVADQLGIEPSSIQLDSAFVADLGADSLDTVELVMTLEDHFQIEIPDDDAESITTPRKAIEYISKLK